MDKYDKYEQFCLYTWMRMCKSMCLCRWFMFMSMYIKVRICNMYIKKNPSVCLSMLYMSFTNTGSSQWTCMTCMCMLFGWKRRIMYNVVYCVYDIYRYLLSLNTPRKQLYLVYPSCFSFEAQQELSALIKQTSLDLSDLSTPAWNMQKLCILCLYRSFNPSPRCKLWAIRLESAALDAASSCHSTPNASVIGLIEERIAYISTIKFYFQGLVLMCLVS